MNFYTPQVASLLLRAPWNELCTPREPPFFMKHICHVSHGLCVVVTDFSCTSFVGNLGAEQMIRNVSASAPGIQLESTELLRVVDESCRQGNAQLGRAQVVGSSCSSGTLTVNFAVDVIADHHLRAAVKLDLVNVADLTLNDERTPERKSADFVRDFALRPLLQFQGALQQLLQTIVEQRRVTAEELTLIARTSASSVADNSHAPWLQELRLRCFPSGERTVQAPPSVSTAPSPLASRGDSTYVESPEELQRKRHRQETAAPPKGVAETNMKKIRKALR